MSKFNLINDNDCGWINQIHKRINTRNLKDDLKSDYLVIGAGYGGLSAARKLSEIYKDKKIILIDAQLAGEGDSGRRDRGIVDCW